LKQPDAAPATATATAILDLRTLLATFFDELSDPWAEVGVRALPNADTMVARLAAACTTTGVNLRVDAQHVCRKYLLRSFVGMLCDQRSPIPPDALMAGMRALRREGDGSVYLVDDTAWLDAAGTTAWAHNFEATEKALNHAPHQLATPFFFRFAEARDGDMGHWVLLHIRHVFSGRERSLRIECHNSLSVYAPSTLNHELERVAQALRQRLKVLPPAEIVHVAAEKQPSGSLECGAFVVRFAAGLVNAPAKWLNETRSQLLEAQICELAQPLPPPPPPGAQRAGRRRARALVVASQNADASQPSGAVVRFASQSATQIGGASQSPFAAARGAGSPPPPNTAAAQLASQASQAPPHK
jgi:hypothetical protein